MKRTMLKNIRGEIVGFRDTDERGRSSAKDVHGRMVGRYNPQTNLTQNVRGKTETHGDSLSSFLTRD